ncbi:MAG: excinuclease ABC subunit UvrA [Rhodocyclaceae bacterium]
MSAKPPVVPHRYIRIRGARQNNLKNLDLDIPTGELVVVTGPSGSGKSSLVFDTLYAEGQRRYVETFSPYARQFLDRMDKPQVDRIDGVPPAIAIDQANQVRTSRSTVGTMTELADYLKLLYARAAHLHCRQCGRPVQRDSAETILADFSARAAAAEDPRLAVVAPMAIPDNFSADEMRGHLDRQGYTRVVDTGDKTLAVVVDRFRAGGVERARAMEALEKALQLGSGRVAIHVGGEVVTAATADTVWRYSSDLHCAHCDIHYAEATPAHFSFNSAVGACETCRGFGRVIGIDAGLIVPDESKTLADGAVRPWQSESYNESQRDLMQYAKKRGVPTDVPWRELSADHRQWVMEGEANWRGWQKSWPGTWYGVRRFFDWLETKAYKMHIRVLLSRYRAYTDCPACLGARLKTDSLLWRVGTRQEADAALGPARRRFRPNGATLPEDVLQALPGLSIHDVMRLPVERTRDFVATLTLAGASGEAVDLVMTEVRARIDYLCAVGLGYLTLDRQSRTLSGGEVQRINLTTALGTSLTNTLFVLDEPSVGLHPRDIDRINGVMRRLRDAGNSLVVVEHDPAVMLNADRIIDIGPGPGAAGGRIVFEGSPDELRGRRDTVTARYLGGHEHVDAGLAKLAVDTATPRLRLTGARANNLKNVNLSVPLERLVCVTGVSGSGKSTLIQDILYPAMKKAKGESTEAPGEFDALDGDTLVDAIVMVDQSAIGKTTRSNPASYVGAFDVIRKRYAALPEAAQRGYTAGTFSFNSGDGRCPTCGGNGFEHVEMQFLSDVYLRCPDCDGKRYRPEVLELKLHDKSIAELLELTAAEALEFFRDDKELARVLQPLVDVGLDYLTLGQPVPTLSGGEAQRLKLAGHLAEASTQAAKKASKSTAKKNAARRGTLFLFDEPTTGLHFGDVAKLLRALRALVDAGNSVLVVEHNLDVMRAADWLIDLGPEGGDAGGEIIAEGTQQTLMDSAASHTGRALRDYDAALSSPAPALMAAEPRRTYRPAAREAINIVHAREHNLKNISVDIGHNSFTVVTGVSGSGKSTLAFDILFAEGQRRYLESLNAYARQFVQPAAKAEVDAVFGIPPTVAIEQRTSRGGRKSTVGTLTEVHHFLRLLFVKLGTQYCPTCNVPIEPQSFEAIAARILRDYRDRRIGLLAPLVVSRKGLYTDLAKWAKSKGYTHLRVDGEFLPVAPWPRLDRYKEHNIELPVGDLTVSAEDEAGLRALLTQALEFGKGVVQVLDVGNGLDGNATAFSTLRACPCCGTSFPELDPRLFSYNSKHGWCEECCGTGVEIPKWMKDPEVDVAEMEFSGLDDEGEETVCHACHGERLNPTALAVRYHERSIADYSRLAVGGLSAWVNALQLQGREGEIGRDIVAELRSRLSFLQDVGLGYLALDRAAPTLSGGEAQRIRLASQLGSNLQGVCYVLDEPSIGLHPRDNGVLLDMLSALRHKGNTVVVVEHDEETIRRADEVLDLGPGAGTRGGRLIAQGDAPALMASSESVTGACLREPLKHPLHTRADVGGDDARITLQGASLHNLRDATAHVPLGRLTVVTGVSGSGKSTLARDILHANLKRLVGADTPVAKGRAKAAKAAATYRPVSTALQDCAALTGWEAVGRVLEVDQTPIGKTPRSCPATYVGFWDAIRKLFAETETAKLRGWGAARFSFNTGDGRCPACEGAGQQTVAMNFLPDVKVTCDVCGGARFNRETLSATWRGKSIAEVLAMEVDDAVEFFAAHPSVAHPLKLLQDVGLGYLTLGQPSPTLSGGEAQRIKLVTELSKVRLDGAVRNPRAKTPHTLYVLDEPTVGLHMADVAKLIHVLHRLVEAGNTVLVIEHDLDVMAEADWIVDLGPEGGDGGGEVVFEGPVSAILGAATHTADALRAFLARHGRA